MKQALKESLKDADKNQRESSLFTMASQIKSGTIGAVPKTEAKGSNTNDVKKMILDHRSDKLSA